jgi:hypothetical protein
MVYFGTHSHTQSTIEHKYANLELAIGHQVKQNRHKNIHS